MIWGTLAAPFMHSRNEAIRVSDTSKEKLKAELTRRSRILIEAKKGTNYRFTRYGPGGNSPHQLGSEIYLRTGDIRAVEAFLIEFISGFRPKSLSDFLFGSASPSLGPLNDMSPMVKFQPWAAEFRDTPGFVGQAEASFGEVSVEHARKEAKRQVEALNSIRKKGYQPEQHRHGHLRGIILLARGDYRFIVQDGKHRLGALNALGVDEIPVRLYPAAPAVVDEDEVDQWPHVVSGFCSRELALRLLHRHFD